MQFQILLIPLAILYWVECLYYEKKFIRLIPPEYKYYEFERFILTILWPVVVLISLGYIILSSNNKRMVNSVINDD